MNKLKIGILGANSFIGKSLTEKFINDNDFSELHLFARNLNTLHNEKGVYEHPFNLNSDSNLFPISLLEIDILYYLISDSIPASSWNAPCNELQNNLIPFIQLIEKLKDGNLKKIIFTSSAGTVYGTSDKKISENSKTVPFSPHGITKLTTEYFLEYFKVKYNIQHEVYRISNIYGPGQNTSKGLGLINTLLEKMIRKEEINIYGNGTNTRNYIYIEDVTKILKLAVRNDIKISTTINLASSYHFSINEIIATIEEISLSKLCYTKLSARSSDNPIILIDNSNLKSLYPEFIETPIQIGIKETLIYLKKIK